jgi:hypothetical protein
MLLERLEEFWCGCFIFAIIENSELSRADDTFLSNSQWDLI